jgi:hypothetical protein
MGGRNGEITQIDHLPALPPEVVELLNTMREQIVDLQARVAALEGNAPHGGARPDLAESEDGRARLAGEWCRMAEAMRRTHYSRSGLLNLCRRGKIRFDFEGAHRIIDITSVPRKISRRECTK